MSNYAWLCDYGSHAVANTYGIVVQTPEFDGVELFFLEQKKKCNTITSDEMKILEALDASETKFWRAWKNYEFIPQQEMPIKLFKKPDINYSNLPELNEIFFCITNAYLVMSKELYHVISQFNLGKTHFSQVYMYDIETKKQLSEVPYYFINIAESYEFLDSNHSKGIKASRYSPEEPLRYIWGAEDDDIILLNQFKNTDTDLWHDKNLNDSLFFSDRLVQVLFRAGFSQKQLGLVRCLVK